MEIEWNEIVERCICDKIIYLKQDLSSKLYIIPDGCIVGDSYPPGDMGPIFLCSELCAKDWLEMKNSRKNSY